jgi:alkylation response protein AidB-like acyl-CoA dehydrogenase
LLAAGAHLFGVAMAIQKTGSDEQRARFLPELARGDRIATVAATEKGAGSDVAQVQGTVSPQDGGGFVANGHKAYVTFADEAGLYLFVGRAPGKRILTTALVPREVGGVNVGAALDTVGLRGARLAPVSFDDCTVDDGCILGRPGAGMAVFQVAMTFERALVLAFRLGAMQRQLDEARHFAMARRLGPTSISQYQAVSHRVARMQRRLEAARLMTYRAAWLLDQGRRGQFEAALAKWELADAAVDNALDALRLRGGAGYLAHGGHADVLLDAIGGGIHSGTGDVLAGIVAGWLGL